MNPIHTWFNADEVKQMAEQLMRPPPTLDAQAPQNEVFGSGFVGFAGGEAAPETTAKPIAPSAPLPPPVVPQPIPQRHPAAVPKPPLTATRTPAPIIPSAPIATPAPAPTPALPAPPPSATAPTSPEPLPSPRAAFLKGIRQFRDEIHSQYAATGLFILDHEGAVLFDEGTHSQLHFLARSLALSSRRPGTAAANVHIKINVATTLEIIPVETPLGYLVLSAVVPNALRQDDIRLIRDGLVQTVLHPDNSSPLR